MTAENNFTVKPLTNLHYVAPTNKSDEQPERNNRRYKRKMADQQIEESEETTYDYGVDTLLVIDFRA